MVEKLGQSHVYPVRTGCNPQLESESTGKRSGQQNGVLADEGAIRGEEDLG